VSGSGGGGRLGGVWGRRGMDAGVGARPGGGLAAVGHGQAGRRSQGRAGASRGWAGGRPDDGRLDSSSQAQASTVAGG
jgi:hypothetical protein